MQALRVRDVDGLHKRVQLLLGIFIIVALALDADTDAAGNALYPTLPDLLVELGI